MESGGTALTVDSAAAAAVDVEGLLLSVFTVDSPMLLRLGAISSILIVEI